MKRLFTKFAPILAIFGLAVAVFAILRGKKAADASGGSASFIQGVTAAFKGLFSSLLLAAAAIYALWDLQHSPAGLMLAVIWGTVGASTTASFTFNFVPQFMEFVAATSPSLVQVNVNGDGMVFNLDTNGLSSMTHIRAVQRQASSFMFQLADGLLNNKNGTVTITTGVSAVTMRVWSPNKQGKFYCTFNPAQALTTQAYNLQSYAYAAFPNAATTDSYQLAYNDGSLDNLTREELNIYLGWFQNDTVTTAKYNSDNIRPARISQLTFTPTTAQTFYVMKYQSAYGDPVNANPNV